jgi:diguanylate cyclase (GGDEF)-like protein/PAS domain S-box-containing protein
LSLRANTYVALIGCAFLAVALIFVVTIYAGRAWIHSSERQIADSSMMQVKKAVDFELDSLAINVHDWAARDDTYRYLQDGNAAYRSANLDHDLNHSLDIDAFLFVDREGRIVYESLSPGLAANRAAVASLHSEVRAGGDLLRRSQALRGARGAIRAGSSAMLFAAWPVLPSNEAGPSRGTLLMGRYLDDSRVEALGAVAGVTMLQSQPEDPSLPTALRARIAGVAATHPVVIEVRRPLNINGYLRLDDIHGRPALVLSSHEQPLSYDMAMRVLTSLIGTFLVGGLIWALLAFAIVDRASLSRIVWLRDAVSEIGESGGLASRIDLSSTPRADEATSVASEVNSMLSALEGSHQRVVQSEEHHRVLVESMADAVFTTTGGGRFSFANARAEELTGRSRAELVGAPYSDVLAQASLAPVERLLSEIECGQGARLLDAQFVRRDGWLFPVELSVSPVCDQEGNLTAVHWIARDITERKRFENQLLHLASHDHLTGLFNRRRFEEEIAQHLAENRRHGDTGALLWIDVDDFKTINDTFGHRVGDEALARIASILGERTREEHILCRLGGDEFAVLVPRGDEEAALAVAQRVLEELRNTVVVVDEHSVRLSASIGIALFPRHATGVDELLLHADIAMYRAKEGGRNRACMYSPDDDWPAQLNSRREWAAHIEEALAGDELLAYAQPIFDLATQEASAYELLVRMAGADGSVLEPGEFLSAAEDLGLVTEIDRWMVRKACALVAQLPPERSVALFVNLSGKTLSDASFPSFVRRVLNEAGVEPRRIGFELTETALVANMSRAREFIETLRHMGCRFALDDFGSGFSSLNYLRHMPVDVLKIDGSLIREIPTSVQDRHFVRAIVDLARGLGIEVTAEFVENQEILDFLCDVPVDSVQGYFIGSPKPAEQIVSSHEPTRIDGSAGS